MKKQIALIMIGVMIVVIAGCGEKAVNSADSSQIQVPVSQSTQDTDRKEETTEVSEDTEDVEEVVNLWGDRVFTKEEVQAKIDEGLSDNWETYELNAVLQNIYGLPQNVLSSLENAFGAYKWESWEGIVGRPQP